MLLLPLLPLGMDGYFHFMMDFHNFFCQWFSNVSAYNHPSGLSLNRFCGFSPWVPLSPSLPLSKGPQQLQQQLGLTTASPWIPSVSSKALSAGPSPLSWEPALHFTLVHRMSVWLPPCGPSASSFQTIILTSATGSSKRPILFTSLTS